jgi:SagB-type dehydrogenase family enzyme
MDIFQKRSRKDALRRIYDSPDCTSAEVYHEASKINEVNGLSFRRRIGLVLGSPFYLKLITRGYKTYPTARKMSLPGYAEFEDTARSRRLREITLRRRSVRKFTGETISLNNVAHILFNSYGTTGRMTLSFGIEQDARAVPSGGALYPLELYFAAHKVDGLEPGIYHYNVEGHSLELVRQGQFSAEFGRALFYEDMFKNVAGTLVITAVPRRSSLKYGERSYRFINLEAGHVGQAACLTSCALDIGCVMLGGFYDDDVDDLIGVDGVNEMTLYTCAFGRVERENTESVK